MFQHHAIVPLRGGLASILALAAALALAGCDDSGQVAADAQGGAAEGARAAGEILSDYKAGIFP